MLFVVNIIIPISTIVSAEVQNAEENTTVTLHCPVATRDYISRVWFKGYINVYNTSTHKLTLFSQISSRTVYNSTDRADMSVDPSTFALTISKVRLEDDSYFTCKVLDRKTLLDLYNQSKIEVYSK